MKILTIDDTHWGNIIISRLLEKHRAKNQAIFFASLNDNNNPVEIIKLLSVKGCIVGSHTIGHPSLTQVSYGRAKYEIEESKKQIESITGKECTNFAYPHGDYNDKIARMVQEAGYKMARTCEKTGDDQFRVPSFYLDGINWDEAMMSDMQYYHLHFVSLETNSSIEELDRFISWMKQEAKCNLEL